MNEKKLGVDVDVTVEYYPDKSMEEIIAIANAKNEQAVREAKEQEND